MKHFIAAAGLAALVASSATAQDATKTDAAPAAVKQQVQAPRLSGKLLGLDGKTAWAGRMVKVTPVGKTATLGVMTDRQGQFTLPALQPGAYVIQVGKLVRTLTVVPGQTQQPLVLLASRDVLESDAVPMGQAVVAGGSSLVVPLVVGGVVTGFVIGGVTYSVREVARDQRLSRHRDNYYERLRQSPSTL